MSQTRVLNRSSPIKVAQYDSNHSSSNKSDTFSGSHGRTLHPIPKLSKGSTTRDAYNSANKYRIRDDRRAFATIFLDYAVCAIALCTSELVSIKLPQQRCLAWITYVLSVLAIASRMRGLENLVHEASHHNLFQQAGDHRKWQFIYAFPVFKLLDDYRASHLVHHSDLGDPVKDPDMQRILALGMDKWQERPLWFVCGLPLTGYLQFEWIKDNFLQFWLSNSAPISKTAYWLFVASVVYALDSTGIVLKYYAVPLLAVLPIIRYWAEAAEHVGLDMTSAYGHSRSNLGFMHRWYLNPHNDGYHTVHHIHSQVPFHALPQAHDDLVATHDGYRDHMVASYSVAQTFRQMAKCRTILKVKAG